MSSPSSSPDRIRNEKLAISSAAITTTMEYADDRPNSQPPPIERLNTKYGMFVEPRTASRHHGDMVEGLHDIDRAKQHPEFEIRPEVREGELPKYPER